MELYDHISEFKEYFNSIRLHNDIIILDIKLPVNWEFSKLVKDGVSTKVNNKTEDQQLVSFYAPFTKNDTDKLIKQVREIIKWNKDLEEKDELLTKKIFELKKIFNENKVTSLRRLDFNFKNNINLDEERKDYTMVPEPNTEGPEGSSES